VSFRITSPAESEDHFDGWRLAWQASDVDGIVVGSARLRLFTRPAQRYLAVLRLDVGPEDAGRSLLDAAISAAIDLGRRRVIALVRGGSPAEKVLVARAFGRVLTLTSARLSPPDADLTALTRKHPGYRLTSWDGMVPGEFAETFVASRHAMDDAPAGGIDFGAIPWSVDRIRAAVATVENRGEILHTVVAVSEADGMIAGFTELAIPRNGRGEARQHGTAVLREHRGHGLAGWMKAAAISYVRERYPLLEGLLTDTADNNPWMRRVNDALGYVPTHTTYEYQLHL
jgi:GNAT superfamily N-acetyltransferase